MAVQTSYPQNMAAGRVGALVNAESANLISRTIETADGVEFGRPVTQGAQDASCKLAEAGDSEILGISVRTRTNEAENANKFAQYATAKIATKGVIWVESNGSVAAGDPVYVTLADASFGNAGDIQITNARWDSSSTGAALAQLRLA